MITPNQIKEHMEVVGNDGLHVGVIDRVEAGEIRPTKNDAPTGCTIFCRSPTSSMWTTASTSIEAAFVQWRSGVDDLAVTAHW
jgi:Uncharacterized protein conserved in bacteria (DUF2171)